MRHLFLPILALSLASCVAPTVPPDDVTPETGTAALLPTLTTMNIESPAFTHDGTIPAKHTCDGQNMSPPLRIFDIPEGAKSLALIVDDPDAVSGTFTHWTVWNIDPTMTEFAEGSAPTGAVQGMTSFGKQGYGGPCPPSGEHRYFFKAYALSQVLDLAPTADVNQLRSAMSGSILEEAELMGWYSRQ